MILGTPKKEPYVFCYPIYHFVIITFRNFTSRKNTFYSRISSQLKRNRN